MICESHNVTNSIFVLGGLTFVSKSICCNDFACFFNNTTHIDTFSGISRFSDRQNMDVLRINHMINKTSNHFPMTFLAPACAANILKIPVPHPTSSTILSLESVF